MVYYHNMFGGCIVAALTPIKNQSVDLDSFVRHLTLMKENGINNVVITGSTGEGSLLDNNERVMLWKNASKIFPDFIAGVNAISTYEAIKQSVLANECGCSAIMITPCPYINYNKGFINYINDIVKNADTNILLYNNPARVGYEISINDIKELSKNQRVVGIKESGNWQRIPYIKQHIRQDFAILSGNDYTFGAMLCSGADGIISVLGNIVPKLFVAIYEAFIEHTMLDFIKYNTIMLENNQYFMVESNPIPVKYAASKLNLMLNEFKKPLYSIFNEDIDKSIISMQKWIIKNV